MSKLSRSFWLGAGLCMAVSATPAPALAQEAADTPAVPAEQAPGSSQAPRTGQTQPERELTEAEQRQAGDKGGVFRPSENISEDFPMAFPVDI